MATSHLNSIKIWDIRNPNSPEHYINAHPSKIYALDFSPVKENQLVSSAADNTIKMWNVSKPQKPVNILKVRDGSPVWKVKYTVRWSTTLLFIIKQGLSSPCAWALAYFLIFAESWQSFRQAVQSKALCILFSFRL